MNETRRTFLKLGSGIATTAVMAKRAVAARPGINVPAVTYDDSPALRLATFIPSSGGAPRVGAVTDEGIIIDLGKAAKHNNAQLNFNPSDMVSLISAGPAAIAACRHLATMGSGEKLANVTLLAPIPNPTRNVYAVGWNYLEHFNESLTAKKAAAPLPKHPVFFTKDTHTVNGPFAALPYDPAVSTKVDWEGELAVIIGKRGKNITEANALPYVFGFTVINDTTARDIQMDHGGQWFKGKSLDGHGPMGPWIVAADDIDYNNLNLSTRINGVLKQHINTSQMYFKIPRIIAELSLGLTLEPGDIIATGTPSGIGAARNPPEFLKPGDVMETEIDRIGVIRNTFKLVTA
ncbi:MAG: fumarylacetoacetate hydrolase family protein [Rhodospirillales bacterium]|nr:fumarylacetoacetate hydrolase family protein [Rhodospirillales bacterium]